MVTRLCGRGLADLDNFIDAQPWRKFIFLSRELKTSSGGTRQHGLLSIATAQHPSTLKLKSNFETTGGGIKQFGPLEASCCTSKKSPVCARSSRRWPKDRDPRWYDEEGTHLQIWGGPYRVCSVSLLLWYQLQIFAGVKKKQTNK